MVKNEFIESIIEKMSLDELCGQLMDLNVNGKLSTQEIEEMAKKMRPGSIFVTKKSKEQIKEISDAINKHTPVPRIVSADIVEVSPPYDVSGITALAAAAIGLDLLYLWGEKKN